MKNRMHFFILLAAAGLFFPVQALCGGALSNEEIVEELRALKARITELENQVQKKDHEIAELREQVKDKGAVGVKGLGDRVRRIEEKVEEKSTLAKWAERIHLSGAIEVEASLEDMDFADPAADDTETSDISLATVELGVDVDVTDHVQGHVLFLWEEGETEPVDVDEGFIIIDGKDKVPLYLNAGKMYVPFGYYESHFVSDPITLEIGETNDTAVKAGFANEWIDICAAGFNGDINETDDADDHIDGFVGSVVVTLPDGLIPNMGLMLGGSYISNIADSDGLEGETPGTVRDYIGGLGAFLSASFMEKVFFEAEYIGATEHFEAGELRFDGGRAAMPRAWNFELAFSPFDRLALGARYEGSDDLGDFQPETQYGGVASYEVFKYTTLSLEFLHGKFENNDERNLLTGQLAVEF
jgi:hypothetical protein